MIRTILLLILIHAVHGREVQVSWDANPASQQVLGYRLYVGGVLAAATSNTTWMLTIPNTEASVSLTAFNEAGESPHAVPLIIPPGIPLPPVTIERSKDLLTWTQFLQIPAQNNQILRVRVEPRVGQLPLVTLEQMSDGAAWSLVTTTPYDPPEFFRLHAP